MSSVLSRRMDEIRKKHNKGRHGRILVGLSTCGIAAGAEDVYRKLGEEKENRGLDISIERCGCSGKCYAEPLVEVSVEGMPTVVYGRVDISTALEIIDKHVLGKKFVNDHIYDIKA